MSIARGVTDLIGRTPLLCLSSYGKAIGAKATLLAKLEGFNNGGSSKDRVAHYILKKAREQGLLKPGATVIEPTSGNTGIGLASLCAAQGIACVIVMPDSMSRERQLLMKAYGARLVLTPGALGMQGAIDKARELIQEIPGSFLAGQFENPANPQAHFETTGPEIWQDTQGCVDVFVAGVGTGGTVTGVGRYLKQQNRAVEIVAVEPADSPVLSGGKPGPHALQGIGAGFVPSVLDTGVIDTLQCVTKEQAYRATRLLAGTQGVLCGISSGAALYAAGQLACREDYAGKTVVALLPDSGERYLSVDGLFS